ncbi:galactose oxidase-like domain-containing protein [Streptomyces longisporoflavus]|uniref:Galactose oxidase-like domain-containing protein n=1 Tax=Streptomyces longisporoflavus TaxID=28044 RepID=A0ABW7QZP1_9ACTN
MWAWAPPTRRALRRGSTRSGSCSPCRRIPTWASPPRELCQKHSPSSPTGADHHGRPHRGTAAHHREPATRFRAARPRGNPRPNCIPRSGPSTVLPNDARDTVHGQGARCPTGSAHPGRRAHPAGTSHAAWTLDITRRDRDGLSVIRPDDHALVPSGWYMFFATDRDGVPSQAACVHVRQAARRRVLRLRARLPPAGTSAPPPPCTLPRTRWRERPAEVLP